MTEELLCGSEITKVSCEPLVRFEKLDNDDEEIFSKLQNELPNHFMHTADICNKRLGLRTTITASCFKKNDQ